MPGGGFGGDSSVKWYVQVDRARDGYTKIDPIPALASGLKVEGVDDTDAGGYFRVVIKLPKDAGQRTDFLNSLNAAVTACATAPAAITITLRIEDLANGGPTEEQVKVTWP